MPTCCGCNITPVLGHPQLNRLSDAMVRAWNADLRSGLLSEASAAKAYRLLRQICQSAVDDRLMREPLPHQGCRL